MMSLQERENRNWTAYMKSTWAQPERNSLKEKNFALPVPEKGRSYAVPESGAPGALWKLKQIKTSVRKNYFLERITNLIKENIDDENYGIQELCRDAGVSRAQLHRKIKQATSYSTTRYINGIRLSQAKVLLLQTDLNITQIAFEVGYYDQRYFSRLFLKIYRQSPRDFRKKAILVSNEAG